MYKHKLIYVVLAAVLSVFCCYANAKSPQIGDMAPDIESCEFSLKQAKGKIVVLYFYPKDNTVNCTIQSKQFANKFDDFKTLGIDVVGVSSDSHESHTNFRKKYNIPFALICDEDKKLITAYDADGFIWPQRVTFLIDREGKIAYIWRQIKVSQHAEEVLNKIKELNL